MNREERVARNEATSRDINERLERAHDAHGRDELLRMVCECGVEECDRLVAISPAEYEDLRSDGTRFAVTHDHVVPDVERVIERTDRFVVVAKREGPAAEVARERDPRN